MVRLKIVQSKLYVKLIRKDEVGQKNYLGIVSLLETKCFSKTDHKFLNNGQFRISLVVQGQTEEMQLRDIHKMCTCLYTIACVQSHLSLA